ncbi:MAG: hypothetical protein KAI47_09425 [Deltaproteobacteria bacterium]|nr:hypothetical protein [Deltaproteobacteria bacterium]
MRKLLDVMVPLGLIVFVFTAAMVEGSPSAKEGRKKKAQGPSAARTPVKKAAKSPAKKGSKSPAKKGRLIPAALDLAAIPARASASFVLSAKKNHERADKLYAKVLRGLKTASSWSVDPANGRQVSVAVGRIEALRKRLAKASEFYRKARKHERLVHVLAMKAARIRGLAMDQTVDVTTHKKALAEIDKGDQAKKEQARIKGVDLLAMALRNYIRGDMAKAIIVIERAIKAYDQVALAHVFKGSLCYLTHDHVCAKKAWTTALRLEPKNAELRRVLIQIGGKPPKKTLKKKGVKKKGVKK